MSILNNRKAVLFVAVLITVSGLVGGSLMGTPSEAPPAFAAACKASNGSCVGTSPWSRTAAVDVTYIVPSGGATSTPVEPSGDTTWNITAYWNDSYPPCTELTETASVTVSWSGSGWTLSNKSTTTNIVDIDICDEDTCAAEDSHSYGYKLIAEVKDPRGAAWNLRQVVFQTTAVSNGYEVDTSLCELGDAVTVTSQSFSATDSGTFECGYSCDDSGTTLDITYE